MGSEVFVLLLVAVACDLPSVDGAADSCFGSLGCFPNGAPWTTTLRPMPPPRSPEFIDTQFHLYTRNAPNRFTVAHPGDGVFSVDGSDFDGNRSTIFFVHGFTQNSDRMSIMALKNALTAKLDANVVVVDWGKGSSDSNYLHAASNTRVVAATTAQLLRYLLAERGLTVERVHLIGFSLGAHVCGYVGKAVPDIARITALDAAQPGFEGHAKEVRLDVADAVFVDAVHTNGKPTVPLLGFGFVRPLGHVDFFVNGGWDQPACTHRLKPNITSLAELGKAELSAIKKFVKCPHNRALELFISSLAERNCRFWGRRVNGWQRALSVVTRDRSSALWRTPCDRTSCSELGFDSVRYPGRGSFDVSTSNVAPFCKPDAKANTAMAPFYTA